MSELNHRGKQVLYTVISEFVTTGTPVGSRTIAKKSGLELSPASIRNVLADLEEAGYLVQPHTSAGRVPTDKAFRVFIDALMKLRRVSSEDRERILDRLAKLAPGEDFARASGQLLSELTGTAALIVAPRFERLSVKTIRFIRTAPDQLLAVVVTSNGSVHNRFVNSNVSDTELERVHNLLDDVAEGRSLGEIRELFARRLANDRHKLDALRRAAFELGDAAVKRGDDEETTLLIEGSERLFEHPEFSDGDGMRRLVAALDDRAHLIELLDKMVVAKGPAVVVGNEAGVLGAGQLGIVGAAYREGEQSVGKIGVIGPMRMDYPTVVPLVGATAEAMTQVFGEKVEGPRPSSGESLEDPSAADDD